MLVAEEPVAVFDEQPVSGLERAKALPHDFPRLNALNAVDGGPAEFEAEVRRDADHGLHPSIVVLLCVHDARIARDPHAPFREGVRRLTAVEGPDPQHPAIRENPRVARDALAHRRVAVVLEGGLHTDMPLRGDVERNREDPLPLLRHPLQASGAALVLLDPLHEVGVQNPSRFATSSK